MSGCKDVPVQSDQTSDKVIQDQMRDVARDEVSETPESPLSTVAVPGTSRVIETSEEVYRGNIR